LLELCIKLNVMTFCKKEPKQENKTILRFV